MGSERMKHVRNFAIIIVLAVAAWKLPGGGTATGTISNALSIMFAAGFCFLGFRLYMEHRDTLHGLEDRQRGILYAAAALAGFALIATSRLWHLGPGGAIVWLALIGVAAWAIYSVWRAYRTY